MVESESQSRHDSGAVSPENTKRAQQLELDVPSLEAVLQSAPEDRFDWHLGRGIGFALGDERTTQLELFSQVVRVTVPKGQLVVPRREAQVQPEGVVFEDGEDFVLSVGPTGDVLFQYSPASGPQPDQEQPGASVPIERPDPLPSPTSNAPEKPKSERHVGRLGEVRTHRTKAGKLVAEVELTVADPDRPGASRLVKFVAFGEKAEALQRDYRPGQEVTAVGVPHELQRTGKDGRGWTERRLYFVQLPKARRNS